MVYDIDSVTIGKDVSSLERGWYISFSPYFLYSDGVARAGAGAETKAIAFWPSKEEAKGFYDGWKTQFNKGDKP